MYVRIFHSLSVAMVLLLASGSLAGAGSSFRELVSAYYDERFFTHPLFADRAGIHEYDDRLDDVSVAGHEAERMRLHYWLDRFNAVESSSLSSLDRDDWEVLVAQIKADLLEEEQVQQWRRDPDRYPRLVTNAIYQLIKRDFAPLSARLRSAISREQFVPTVLATAKNVVTNPPSVYTEIALKNIDANIAFFQSAVPLAFQPVDDPSLQADLNVSNQAVIAALVDYKKYLKDDLLSRSNGSFALGSDNYRLKLEYEEMVDEPLDDLLKDGYTQLHEDQAAVAQTAKAIDPNATVEQVIAKLTHDHPTPEAVISTADSQLAALKNFVIDHKILTLPSQSRPRVTETPPFMRATTVAAMDSPGPLETRELQAFYYVTLPTQDNVGALFNYPALENTSVHEVFPGHFVQYLARTSHPDWPMARKLAHAGSTTEGWAHYTEQMMVDEGLGANDPKMRLAQLIWALYRDCRYIVAIEMHTKGLSPDDATHFFVNQCYQPDEVSRKEVLRGTVDPTYLVYTLGKLQILKLRDDYKKMKGSAFSLSEFHDRFLAAGLVPVRIIRREIMN